MRKVLPYPDLAMSLLAILALGFFLGMRHATDSDHIVAMTTIVSREKSIRAASLVGALWGVGHTLTILLVGGAIVLFGIVFPPRVGLTMELSVAVMLVVLGAMNVAGFQQEMKKLGQAPASTAVEPGTLHDEREAHSTGPSVSWRDSATAPRFARWWSARCTASPGPRRLRCWC